MKVRLGEIYCITSGGTPSKKQKEYYEGGNIKWVKTGDLKEKYLYETDECITEAGLQNSSARLYEADTVLIAMYGATIGATSILKSEACTNQACAAFCKNDAIMPEYLYYFFKSKKAKFIKDGVGGAQPNISAGYLKNVQIELMPVNEQKEIVYRLGKVEELIWKEQKQLEKYNLLMKSRFVEMFGDPLSLDGSYPRYEGRELFVFSSGKFLPDVKRIETGYPVYGGNGIAWHTDEPLIEYDTIVIGRVGAYCGNVHLIKEPVWITDNAIYIKKFKQGIFDIDFLYYLMHMLDFYRYADFSGQPKITQKPLETLRYVAPPIKLQKQFADFVHQVDKLKAATQKALSETRLLFDSLMQQYFG